MKKPPDASIRCSRYAPALLVLLCVPLMGAEECKVKQEIEEANRLKLVFSNGETVVIDRGLEEQAFAIPAGVALEETSVGHNYILTEWYGYPEGDPAGTFWDFKEDTNAKREGIDNLDPDELDHTVFSFSWSRQPQTRAGIMEPWPETVNGGPLPNHLNPDWQPAFPVFPERVILVQNIGEGSAAIPYRSVVKPMLDNLYTESERRTTDGLAETEQGSNVWWFFDVLTGIFSHEIPAQAFYRWKWDVSLGDFQSRFSPYTTLTQVTPGTVSHELIFQGWLNMKAKVDLIDFDPEDGPTGVEFVDGTLQVLTYWGASALVGPLFWAAVPFMGNCKTRETTSVFKGYLAATEGGGVGYMMDLDRSWAFRNDHVFRPLCDGVIRRKTEENFLSVAFANFRPTLPDGTIGLRNLFTEDEDGNTLSPFLDPRNFPEDPLPCERLVANPAFLVCVAFEDPEINKRRRAAGLAERKQAADDPNLWDALGTSAKGRGRFEINTKTPYDTLTRAGMRGQLLEIDDEE